MQELVDRYLEANNARDLDAVMELLHPGVAYFDSFWRETCVGVDFRQYLADWLEIDTLVYKQIGELIIVDDQSVGFRYAALDEDKGEVYRGAEVLVLTEGKILTISDYYCDPRREALEEVVSLSAKRHGAPKYASSGLGAAQRLQVRQQIMNLLDHDSLHLNADLTVHQLAELLGCTPGQFFRVLITDFNVPIDETMVDQPWMLAMELLRGAAEQRRNN